MRLVLGSDPKYIGPDYKSDPICYRARLNEIGSELIFGSDWKKSDPITQKPVNIQNILLQAETSLNRESCDRILFETNRSLTVTGFHSDTLAKNDRVPQSNGLLNRYTCLQQNYNSLNRKTTPFKVSHDHVFETWSATSKIKKCHAQHVTQNSMTRAYNTTQELVGAGHTHTHYCFLVDEIVISFST